jgi:Glycine-zipper domain
MQIVSRARSRVLLPALMVLCLGIAGCSSNTVKGAAIGAAGGATVGLFTGDVAQGAAAGAAGGAAAGFVSGLFY